MSTRKYVIVKDGKKVYADKDTVFAVYVDSIKASLYLIEEEIVALGLEVHEVIEVPQNPLAVVAHKGNYPQDHTVYIRSSLLPAKPWRGDVDDMLLSDEQIQDLLGSGKYEVKWGGVES